MKKRSPASLIFAGVLLASHSTEAQSETAFGRECLAAAAFKLDGVIDYDKLKAASAIALCEKTLAEMPRDLSLLAFYSRALRKAGRNDDAARAARTSMDGGSRMNANAWGLGEDLKEAARLYRLVAEETPRKEDIPGYVSGLRDFEPFAKAARAMKVRPFYNGPDSVPFSCLRAKQILDPTRGSSALNDFYLACVK